MKDEEMAEEYADRTRIVDENTRAGTDCISLVQDYEGNYIDIHERIKQAFLAGLKAGRPQWHKVADGDLPTTVGRRFLVSNRYCTMIGYWNGKTFVSADGDTTEIASPVAWCEIPTFDKE